MTRISNRYWMNGAHISFHQNRITKLNCEPFWRIFVYSCFTLSREVALKSYHGRAIPEQQTKTLGEYRNIYNVYVGSLPSVIMCMCWWLCITVCMCVGGCMKCTSWGETSFNYLNGRHILRACWSFSRGLPWQNFRVTFRGFLIFPRLLW